VGREHGVVSHHVEARRRDERREARDEVERIEQDGVGAVLPRGLESVANLPVAVHLEAFLRERRPSDVAAQALEALSVAAVDVLTATGDL
jgi:hypothetical protein